MRSARGRMLVVWAAAFVLLVTSSTMRGQAVNATLLGTVTDSSAAADESVTVPSSVAFTACPRMVLDVTSKTNAAAQTTSILPRADRIAPPVISYNETALY